MRNYKVKWQHKTKFYTVNCYKRKGEPDCVEIVCRKGHSLEIVAHVHLLHAVPRPPTPPLPSYPNEEELLKLMSVVMLNRERFEPKSNLELAR